LRTKLNWRKNNEDSNLANIEAMIKQENLSEDMQNMLYGMIDFKLLTHESLIELSQNQLIIDNH
jgi:hypothetical protein